MDGFITKPSGQVIGWGGGNSISVIYPKNVVFFFAFCALTRLGGRKGMQPLKKNGMVEVGTG